MQNPANLKDEPMEVVKEIQHQVAIGLLCDADMRRRLEREGMINTDFTVGEALDQMNRGGLVKRLKRNNII